MKHAYCQLSIVPLRSAPSLQGEMTSQVLFGESVHILEARERFCRVRLDLDGYEGWMDQRHLALLNDAMPRDTQPLFVDTLTTTLVDDLSGEETHLVRGTALPDAATAGHVTLGHRSWKIRDQTSLLVHQRHFDEATFVEYSKRYLGAPYHWGGRSPFGIDCSGLTQMCWRPFGVFLPRDSYQQREKGEVVDFAQRAPGDLAFFQSCVDGSSHVGLVMPDSRILHASGSVRMDALTAGGIAHAESGKRTHKLSEIRRLAPRRS